MEAIYEVEVTTGSMIHAGTFDNILITLIGTQGVSERTKLDSYGRDFKTGMVSSFFFSFTLGNLLLIRLEKDHFMFLPENDWFCSLVNVRTPEKDLINFPCYRWMAEGEVIELQQAKVSLSLCPLHWFRVYVCVPSSSSRGNEFKTGLPQHACFQEPLFFPSVVRFSFTKDMDSAFNCSTLHWMDDDFLRYQLLNGPNPMMIHRCTELPLNFAITDEPFVKQKGSSGQGNIFLCDNKRLADLPTQVINGKQQHVASPLCLLYRNQVGKFLPIAFQVPLMGFINLRQYQNGLDQILKYKIAFKVVQMKFLAMHIINQKLGFYVFAVMYFVCVLLSKLLVPHTRYTLQINTLIRNELLGPEGAVTQNTSIGDEGMTSLLKKALSDLTYSSLCLPEDISDRGLESVPNFFCRDGGHRLWSFINEVMVMCSQWDTELQDWIKEIFIHGFLEQSSTGESDDSTVEKVIKFVAMVICSFSSTFGPQSRTGNWFPNQTLIRFKDYFCQMSINDRNNGLQVPYTYMCPDNISNSVSI
uniref:PLAT domain-containing protein n=1 Tax=Sinocyclocheilus grahami TaxID=75366 RepID=A0A672Q8U6_SINGR